MARPRTYDWSAIVVLYERGMSIYQVSEELGIPKSTVARVVKLQGVSRTCSEGQIYGCRRKTAVPSDWSFFPLTDANAWLLGLIYGDGSLRKEGSGFVLTSGDQDIIQKVNALFGGRLHAKAGPGCQTLQVNSSRLFRELTETYRLQPAKAAHLIYPDLPADLSPHFVRGLLDSDGCWSFDARGAERRLVFSYSSKTKPFVETLRRELVSRASVSQRRTVRPFHGSWSLVFANHDAVAIGHWLYSESSPEMRGERKYDIWSQFS